jgi:HSP20 family protein
LRTSNGTSIPVLHADAHDVVKRNGPHENIVREEKRKTMAIDLWRTRPYSAFNSPLRQWVDRVFDDALARDTAAPGTASAGFQSLPVNVWETPEGYQAALLAPGLDEQSINVTVHDDTLAIEGELQFSVPEGAKPIWQEFGPTKFRRSLRLGTSVDPNRVEAMYRNGLLLVTMPKAEHAKPRQIPVQVGAAAKTSSSNGTTK